MDIILVTTIIASLFVVIGLAEPFAARLQLPFSVILAVVGILIGASAIFFLRTDLTDALNPMAAAILGLPIRSNVFLYVFLPTLLFQATLGMNLRRMVDDWVPILVLAVVAVVVATVSIGYALFWVSAIPLAACLLIGAIVLIILTIIAILAPWIAPHDPYAQSLMTRMEPPVFLGGDWEHPLGTDHLGRDYLSRLIYGARISLLIGAVAALISGVIGTAMGVAAGYFGGKVDAVVTFLINVRLAMPVVLVLSLIHISEPTRPY